MNYIKDCLSKPGNYGLGDSHRNLPHTLCIWQQNTDYIKHICLWSNMKQVFPLTP